MFDRVGDNNCRIFQMNGWSLDNNSIGFQFDSLMLTTARKKDYDPEPASRVLYHLITGTHYLNGDNVGYSRISNGHIIMYNLAYWIEEHIDDTEGLTMKELLVLAHHMLNNFYHKAKLVSKNVEGIWTDNHSRMSSTWYRTTESWYHHRNEYTENPERFSHHNSSYLWYLNKEKDNPDSWQECRTMIQEIHEMRDRAESYKSDIEYDEESINKLYYRSPGVFIESGVELFDMSVILSTNFKLDEIFKIANKESTKLNMWNHISLILDNKELKIYVNGNLDSTHNLMGTPFNNEYPLYITPGGGFAGKLHYMRYYNYARTDDEVKKDLSETAPPDLVISNIPVEEYISKPEQYKPTENLNDPNSSTLHSSFGWLPNISSLFKIKSVRRNIYLQANFQSLDGSLNDYYNVNKILLQGHGNKNAYVKQFKVMYFDYYDNDWRYYNNGEILTGNINNFDIKEVSVNILTNKIRILPQNWNLDSSGTHLLGLRVGFNGIDKKPNRCDKKISMCKVDQMMKDKERSFNLLSKRLDETVDHDNIHEIEHTKLKNRIDKIQLELNKSRMKTLLYKHGKCSDARERVLPDTTLATSNTNNESNCNISNFNIRDHPDFYRYLNNVKMERLCKHLMKVSPNKYDSLESCINIMIDKIEKNKKNK